MEWVAALTACVSALFAITGYFVKKHIETVEKDIRQIHNNIGVTKQDIIALTNRVSEISQTLTDIKREQIINQAKNLQRLEDIRDVVYKTKDRINEQEKEIDNYGKIIKKYLIE